jgi:mannosylglycerate hydrolase MGH1-like protein
VRADGLRYAYTCPGTARYRHQWHWDSCLHAIAWCRYDAARAREELRTLLRSGRADGFLPHTVFWHDPPRWRRAPLYATQRTRGSRHTTTIGPPLLPFAWERVARAGDDPAFAGEALPALAAHLEWLEHERDVDGDGLLTIVLPDESGLDDSPKYDRVYGRATHYRSGYFALVSHYGRLGWSARRIAADGDRHLHVGDDNADRTIEELDVDGGPFPGGDGLLIDRGRLLVVQGSTPQFTNGVVNFIKLKHGGRRGELDDQRSDPSLRGPSTIARARNLYLIVNADFATSTTPFTVTGLPR